MDDPFEAEVARHRATDGLLYRAEDVALLSEAERAWFAAAIEAARRDGRLLSGPPSRWDPGQRRAFVRQLVERGGPAYDERDLVERMSHSEREFHSPEVEASVERGDFVPAGRGGLSVAEIERGAPAAPARLVFEDDFRALSQREREPVWRAVERGEVEVVPSGVGRAAFERLVAERGGGRGR